MLWVWVLLAFTAGSFFGAIVSAVVAAIRKEWCDNE